MRAEPLCRSNHVKGFLSLAGDLVDKLELHLELPNLDPITLRSGTNSNTKEENTFRLSQISAALNGLQRASRVCQRLEPPTEQASLCSLKEVPH